MSDESILGWLHITDIHVGQPREGGRLANIERAFLNDLTQVLGQERLVIGVVFLSGDIAYRGADAEYVRASAVLGRICDHIDKLNREIDPAAVPPVVVPVPGNHDLMRPLPRDAESIRAALAGRTQASPPLWPPGQEGVRDLVDGCFAGYRAWLRTHPLPFPPGAHHGILPGDLRATVTRAGISLGIVGLNSTCLHLGDTEPGSLHVDLSQAVSLLGPNPRGWVESHHFNVLVTHHPPSWLSTVARTILDEEIKPNSLFDLHLYGHDHVGHLSIDPGANGVRHLIEGRSLFGAEEDGSPRLHGYTVGRFVLSAPKGAERSKRVELWTRQGWRDSHGWRFGPSDERWGRWRLIIDLGETALLARANTPSPVLKPGLGSLDETAKRSGPWVIIERTEEVSAALDGDADRRWILLSANIPVAPTEPDRREAERAYLESARPDAIRAFVVELARRVAAVDSGFGIIFGGHPTITQALAPLALAASGGGRWLTLVQDEHFWFNLVEEVGVVAHAASVRPFLIKTGGAGPELPKLRGAMLTPTQLAAAVFVGGLKGVSDEFALARARRPEVPCFAVGLGGGAAASLLLNPGTELSALGATPANDQALVKTPARLWHTPKDAVSAIFESIPSKP